MHRTIASALLITAMAFSAVPVAAQGTVPNPLRTRATEQKPPETPKAEAEKSQAARDAKPKRERSAKQKQNDDDMRACGASWRAEKETLAAKGTNWRSYLKDCRAAKKAGRERA
jgi:hypothetical protein